MNPYCKKLQHVLAAEGPGAVRDDERAQNHLVDCTHCFAFLETLGALEGHLRALPLVDAPDEVVDALLARPEIAGGEPETIPPARKGRPNRFWPWLERNRRPGPLVWAAGATATVAVWVVFAVYLTGQAPDLQPAPARSIIVTESVPPSPKSDGSRAKVEARKQARRLSGATPDESEPTARQNRESTTESLVPDAEYTTGAPEAPPSAEPLIAGQRVGEFNDETRELLESLGYVASNEFAEEDHVEHVEVYGDPAEVELRSTSASSKFSDEYIQDLPVSGRFYQNVLTLAPGVQDADGDVRTDSHGSRNRDFKTEVGGVSNVDPLAGEDKSSINPNSIEEMQTITAGAQVEFDRAQGGLADRVTVASADAARKFLAERASLEGLRFEDPAGYWANTYVPGDPGLRLLQWRLQHADRSAILPDVGTDTLLHDGSRRPAQPFDPPTDSALAVFLQADRSTLDQEGRMLLQVGLRGAARHGGSRPAMNLGIVLDLRGEIPVNVAASMRALLDALNEAKQPGDRFRVVVAGRPGATVVRPADFRHGYLAVTLESLFGEESQPDGTALDLVEASATAIRDVAGADDPSMPLGSSAVLLVTHQPFGDTTGTLADMAHQSAVAGVPVSVVGIGDGASLDQVDRVTLSGQGNRRLLGSAAEAAGLIDRELAATSRAIARAVRLRIRLAPGVRLLDVVGSTRLDKTTSRRVREAEASIDLRLARNLGIEADRGADEEGIQVVIPNFYAGDTHSVLLDVVAAGAGPVADVTARYKDLVFLRNGVARANLTLPSGDEVAGPLQRGVLRGYLAHRLYETLDEAGVALADGDQDDAVELLTEFHDLLEGLCMTVPGFERDADLARDIAMLDEYREVLGGNGAVAGAQLAYLSDSLRYAARLKVLPPYAAN